MTIADLGQSLTVLFFAMVVVLIIFKGIPYGASRIQIGPLSGLVNTRAHLTQDYIY